MLSFVKMNMGLVGAVAYSSAHNKPTFPDKSEVRGNLGGCSFVLPFLFVYFSKKILSEP